MDSTRALRTIATAAMMLATVGAPAFAADALSSRTLAGVVPMIQAEQNVRNPSAVQFTPSTDQANVESYELDILRPDGSVLQTLNVGKPTPDANNVCTAPINVQPVQFGVGYSVRMRAIAGGAASDYAVSENKFDRVPGGPSKVKVGG